MSSKIVEFFLNLNSFYNWPARGRDIDREKLVSQAKLLSQQNSALSGPEQRLFNSRISKTDHSKHPILFRRTNSKFMSGYAGHIHRYRDQVGSTWTETSQAARWDFQKRHNRPETAKQVVNPNIVRCSTVEI